MLRSARSNARTSSEPIVPGGAPITWFSRCSLETSPNGMISARSRLSNRAREMARASSVLPTPVGPTQNRPSGRRAADGQRKPARQRLDRALDGVVLALDLLRQDFAQPRDLSREIRVEQRIRDLRLGQVDRERAASLAKGLRPALGVVVGVEDQVHRPAAQRADRAGLQPLFHSVEKLGDAALHRPRAIHDGEIMLARAASRCADRARSRLRDRVRSPPYAFAQVDARFQQSVRFAAAPRPYNDRCD